MDFHRKRAAGAITRIELFLIIAILAVIAAPVTRVVFADKFRAFDEALFRRLGIDPGLGRIVAAALWLMALVAWAVYCARARRRRARLENQPFLRMPRQNDPKS